MIHPHIPVSLAGERALKALTENGGGAVLSSHLTGFYCRLDDGSLLLVHDQGAGVIPFGLGCAPPPFPQGWKTLEPGTPLTMAHAERRFRAGEFCFGYENAATPRLVFPWEDAGPDMALLRAGLAEAASSFDDPARQGVAAACLMRREALFSGKEALPSLDDMWENALWEPLQRLLAFCLGKPEATAPDAPADPLVAALIGLGPGLTPLGDDILCGLLATGFILKKPFPCAALVRLTETIAPATARNAKGLTTSQSIAFLQSAAAGERFGMLDAVMAAVYANSAPEREKAFAAALNVGHSSGSGLVLGLFLATELAVRDSSAI